MRGGKRPGAGRPKGRKEKGPRARNKQIVRGPNKDIELFDKFNKGFYLKIKPYLSADVAKQYEKLVTEGNSPLECLKFVLQDLMVRYKIGRIEELKANKTWKGITGLVDSIRQLVELIDRIESNRPSLQVNILNILKEKKYENDANRLMERMFDLPEGDFEIGKTVEQSKKTDKNKTTMEDKSEDKNKTKPEKKTKKSR